VLSEGDRVRIVGGKPGTYRGESTLAVTHDTELVLLEEGAGPSPIHWRLYRVGWENSTSADGSSQSPKPVRAGASGGERVVGCPAGSSTIPRNGIMDIPPRGVPRVVAGERERSSA
jgi:hypothetical protein